MLALYCSFKRARPVKERILAAIFTSLLLGSAGRSQNLCPIEVQKVDPKSYPLSAGLLGAEKDPWDRYLRIEYKNTSGKSIVAIRFEVEFINSLAEAKPSVYSYVTNEIVQPGKISKPYWGDGVYFQEYGYSIQAVAWAQKIRFSDNTFFVDDGSKICSFPKSSFEDGKRQVVTPDEVTAVAHNSEAGKNAPAAAASLAEEGHVLSPEEMAERVKKGEASKCAVITIPAGAKIWIDGNEAGISPMAFVLLRRGDVPRSIKVTLNGYKTVEKQVTPDGKVIPIALTLEPN
jgi:hypothetical protein